MNVLDLFSGIGGFSLGLERAGMRTVAFCEVNEWCRAVLRRHWPAVPIYEDVRELTAERLAANAGTGDIAIDVIAGGFPCQDISRAGHGLGLAGERSGLWSEFARLIGEIRPRYAIVENVAALLDPGRGMDAVCGDLASLGYDAEWSLISACSVGAPHVRQRVFIVAYPDGQHGRSGVRHPATRSYRALQEIDGFQGARARARARLANPSELYRDADGLPFGMDRNRGVGNSVHPGFAEIIGRAIMSAHAPNANTGTET
jgi:DNA (cytosine-5)-methyltransferase 1